MSLITRQIAGRFTYDRLLADPSHIMYIWLLFLLFETIVLKNGFK